METPDRWPAKIEQENSYTGEDGYVTNSGCTAVAMSSGSHEQKMAAAVSGGSHHEDEVEWQGVVVDRRRQASYPQTQ